MILFNSLIFSVIWSRDPDSRRVRESPVERLISASGANFGAWSKYVFFQELFCLSCYRLEIFYGLGIFKNLKLLVNKVFKKPSVENFYLVTQHQFSTKMPGI